MEPETQPSSHPQPASNEPKAPPAVSRVTTWYDKTPCPACGYSLEGHANPAQCPECGEDFSKLPGGVNWFAGERLRMVATSSLVLAIGLLLTVSSPTRLGKMLSDETSLEMLAFSAISGGNALPTIGLLLMPISGFVLWAAAPRPRNGMLAAAAVVLTVFPIATLGYSLYSRAFFADMFRNRFSGSMSTKVDWTLVVVGGLQSVLFPLATWMLGYLVCRHLAELGLHALSKRMITLTRPLLYVVPLLIDVDQFLGYFFTVSANGQITPGMSVQNQLVSGGSSGITGDTFSLMISAISPIATFFTLMMILLFTYASLRLCLRARWILESSRKA